MAKVKMLRNISGTRNGKKWPAVGEVADVSQDEARVLVRQRMAEYVKEPAPKPSPKRKPKAEQEG